MGAGLANSIRSIREDIIAIQMADGYTNEYLKQGTQCDSSKDAKRRIGYVLEAERDFVLDHQKEILAIAARRLEEELHGAKISHVWKDEVT